MMPIIIPTRKRTNSQLTIKSFNKELRDVTTIVCPEREAETFRTMRINDPYHVVAQPDPEMKIAAKRAWIMHEWARRGHDKILMLDDDLRFSTRIREGDWHLREIAGDELAQEFKRLEEKLGPEFPHVGLGQRQGNQLVEPGWKVPGKMCYVLGYYLPIVLKECKLDLVELREDMAVTLQLLLKGYPNAVLTETVTDQREYGKKDSGGCWAERSMGKSNEEARRLAALFPNYVTVADRKYKASTQREEVIIQWKRALEDGIRHRSEKAT